MKPQKGSALIFVLGGLAVIFAAGMLYFYLQNKQLTNQTQTPVPPSQTTQLTKPVDETANWKTLISVYGYSIKYPATWFVNPATKDRLGSLDQIMSYDTSKITSGGKDAFENGQTKLEFGKDSQVYDLTGVEERFGLEKAQLLSKEKLNLNGYSSIKVVQESPGGKMATYFIEKKYPEIYFISIYGDQSGPNKQVIDQILSSFKFTDSSDSGTQWKTYTNAKYGFQLTYPSTGIIAGPTYDPNRIGECGMAIKENYNFNPDPPTLTSILVDNFFVIVVKNWNGSIGDYIKSHNAEGVWKTASITTSRSDEAVLFTGPSQNYTKVSFPPPLSYVYAIYHKGNIMVLLYGLQNPGNFGGCISPSSDQNSRWIENEGIQFIN